MSRRRLLYTLLSILALFLVGTVVVLSSVTYYLAIDPSAYLSELEVPVLDNVTRWNASEYGQTERIPRIIHQTWKTDSLPVQWAGISQACRDMMPDYDYKLWTDAGSRDFIAENYPWFLDTFNDYTYAIQRADAIRYFVLHHYGGIYIDLDVGCLRPLDPLLVYPVILPKTIPVGVSNDLMFSEKGHPFLDQTIHNLATFDHSWILNYPTVMFSTGPMFLSIQYGIFTSSHPVTPGGELRILPKSLYGKNAKESEAPHSFFSHFYGSSWHADDAAFIGFLGSWGKGLMWVGLVILLLGLVRIAIPSNKQRKYSLRRIGGYDVLLPRWVQRNGRWHIDLGWLSGNASQPPSPEISTPGSPISDTVPFLPFPFDDRPSSPASSESADTFLHAGRNVVYDAVRNVRNRVASLTESREEVPRTPIRARRHPYSRGVLFFLPAIFTQTPDIELASHRPAGAQLPSIFHRPASDASQLPPEKQRYAADLERAGLHGNRPSDDFVSEGVSSSGTRTPSENSASLIDMADAPNRPRSRGGLRPLNS